MSKKILLVFFIIIFHTVHPQSTALERFNLVWKNFKNSSPQDARNNEEALLFAVLRARNEIRTNFRIKQEADVDEHIKTNLQDYQTLQTATDKLNLEFYNDPDGIPTFRKKTASRVSSIF